MADAEIEQKGYFAFAASVFGKVSEAIMRDGTIAAAGRQGTDELGQALKAFPDSIQTQEMGTIWSPTPGEIANARSPEPNTPLPSPSQIADNANAPEQNQDRGQVMMQGKWQDKVLEERKGQTGDAGGSDADSYERARGRSLPDEQREKEKSQDRGGQCR